MEREAWWWGPKMKVHTPEVCEHTHTHTHTHPPIWLLCALVQTALHFCASVCSSVEWRQWCYLPPGSCEDQTGWSVQNASTVLPTPTPNPKLHKQQPNHHHLPHFSSFCPSHLCRQDLSPAVRSLTRGTKTQPSLDAK